MKIFTKIPNVPHSVITIGSFDGVHLGHKKLILETQLKAKELDTEEYIISFDPHPRLVLGNYSDFELLTTTQEKIKLLDELGVKNLVLLPFSTEISQLSAIQFLENYIIKPLNPLAVVIGYDHKFGKDRMGSKETFYNYNKTSNKPISIIEFQEFKTNELKINSTNIRHLIKDGNTLEAKQLLGHSYSIQGIVMKGKQIGRTIGFPTANIQISESKKLIPKVGIYKSYIEIDHIKYLAATSIGYNPTINSGNPMTIESYIIDFNRDIYGETVNLYIEDFIRNEEKFNSIEDLVIQIKKDIEIIKSI